MRLMQKQVDEVQHCHQSAEEREDTCWRSALAFALDFSEYDLTNQLPLNEDKACSKVCSLLLSPSGIRTNATPPSEV